MLQIKSTKGYSQTHGIKVLVHGVSGAGKTTLAKTCPAPLILSTESGLTALRNTDLPYAPIKSIADLYDAMDYLATPEGKQYQTIILDSVSDMAEIFLKEEKVVTKDGRQVYGNMAEKVLAFMKYFRDLDGVNVYFVAKTKRSTDENGNPFFMPAFPGSKLETDTPYLFDEVLYLYTDKDEEGNIVRRLLTQPTASYCAKDRSGSLNIIEEPDLGAIFDKINGGVDFNGGTV